MTEDTAHARKTQSGPGHGLTVKQAIEVLNTPATAPRDQWIPAVRIRTTIVFVAVLVGLYGVAQAHTPRTLVLGAFVIYVVAAVLWLRAQYVDAIDGDPTEIWPWLVWTTTLGGVVSVGVGLALMRFDTPPPRPGAFIIPGVLAIYLGIGHLIAQSRALVGDSSEGTARPGWLPGWARAVHARGARLRNSWRALVVVIVLSLAALFVALVLLGSAPTWLLAILLLPSVAVPWFMNLLSEHAIDHLADEPSRRTTVLLVAGALTVVAVGAIGLVWGLLPAVLAGLMVGFAIALASFTMADIAAVLAIVAFMGVTPQQDPADRPLDVPGRNHKVIVVFGDSYMSGEGAATFIAGTDEGGGNECRRSRLAWSMIAGHQPPFDEVVSFACSGADAPNIRRAPDPRLTDDEARAAGFLDPLPFPQFDGGQAQLDEYDAWVAGLPGGTFTPDLVVLSVGGNDAGFSSIGLTCVVPGSCNSEKPRALWAEGNMDRVENRLRQVYTEIAGTFPDTPVVVTPYPDPVHDSALEEKCSTAMLEVGDAIFVKNFLTSLNARILETTVDFGFHYVHTFPGAMERRGLQICDETNGGRAGVNFIGIRSVGGLSEQRFNPTKWHHNSLHPNERGHAALHEAFQRWLAGVGGLSALHPPTPEADRADGVEGETEVSSGTGDCSTFPDDGDDGCRAQSNAWAIGEAGRFAAWTGGLGIGVGLIAWLAAVAFFAWRRALATGKA